MPPVYFLSRCCPTMSPSSLATTSIIGSGHGLHHHLPVAGASRRPHRGVSARVTSASPSFASSSRSQSSSGGPVTYISLRIHVPANPPSFARAPFRSPRSARSPTSRAPKAALGRRGAFKYSRSMAAVRPKLAVRPTGGAEYAWSMSDTPAADFLDLTRSRPASPVGESMQVSSSTAKGKVRPLSYMAHPAGPPPGN